MTLVEIHIDVYIYIHTYCYTLLYPDVGVFYANPGIHHQLNDMATKQCEVRLDGAPAAFVVSLRDGKGNPLEPIDLWVGRPVDVLGRRTTLQHASSTTMDWLTTAAWRFDEAQQVLETALIRLSVKVPKMVHSRDAVQSRTGTTSLRLLSRRTVEMQQMWLLC